MSKNKLSFQTPPTPDSTIPRSNHTKSLCIKVSHTRFPKLFSKFSKFKSNFWKYNQLIEPSSTIGMPIGYEMHPFLKSPKYKALCSPRGWYRCRLARAFCCWPALGGSNHLVPGTKPSAPMYLVPAPGKTEPVPHGNLRSDVLRRVVPCVKLWDR